MRYARVPETIVVLDDREGGKSVSIGFYQYACIVWLDDIRWASPKSNLLSLVKVTSELRKSPGEVMTFEDADYDILRRVIESPQSNQLGEPVFSIRPSLAIQVIGYERAILGASTALE